MSLRNRDMVIGVFILYKEKGGPIWAYSYIIAYTALLCTRGKYNLTGILKRKRPESDYVKYYICYLLPRM